MASIFTYEPDPPRVSSPWLQASGSETGEQSPAGVSYGTPTPASEVEPLSLRDAVRGARRVTRLQAEPQEGPIEYKLHLLLRPRRKFRAISTGSHISGSRHSKLGSPNSQSLPVQTLSDSLFDPASSQTTATNSASLTQQTRQHRLEQLTTQLLWRLQQSSPHHASSAHNIVLPSLPEALPELQAPQQPAKLHHGLEESQGALYEIGVSDDGTLVGLTEDELQESLNNLRAMAACLGCMIEVLRKEPVGECEWLEDAVIGKQHRKIRRTGKLLVAEALVKPVLHVKSPILPAAKDSPRPNLEHALTSADLSLTEPGTEQLRCTLTGPTMSGKSTLLGTLTTSTLDNGRGKSRLSMLRHRHEITSGVTSSVTQEMLGYQDADASSVNVINYATHNIGTWIDIHAASSGSRIVFVSDSAGHPRYRRTTLRGLVGWAPHWTLLCVPADDSDDTAAVLSGTSPSAHTMGNAISDMDLSGAQLDLCLRLNLPLVIVITKLDLASRSGLKNTLSKVLDALKAAGRKPAILPSPSGAVDEEQLQEIPSANIESAYNVAVPLLNDATGMVPIVLTSAVQGTGIPILHALLHELPMPYTASSRDYRASFVFHVEDVYSKPAEAAAVIVSGRLQSGQISVGNTASLGPFSIHDHLEDSEDSDEPRRPRPNSALPTSRSFPGALPHMRPHYYRLPNQEWKSIKVTSIRNLRLPVRTLFADQVGTLAITTNDSLGPSGSGTPTTNGSTALSRIRKGMVLVAVQPTASRTFVAKFRREDLESLAVGNHVVIYSSSVRASAKIVSARAPDSPTLSSIDPDGGGVSDDDDDVRWARNASTAQDPFDFDDFSETLEGGGGDGEGGSKPRARESPRENVARAITAPDLLVTFRLDSTREFLAIGDQVLVMPGGGPGLYGGHERGEKGVAGLEGFVGEIREVNG